MAQSVSNCAGSSEYVHGRRARRFVLVLPAAAPVKVQLPLEGVAYNFEKLLALDERLWVGFDVRGIK